MIKREEIERLPTQLREGLRQHLKACMDKAQKDATDAALGYTRTADEKARATSLIAQGEYNAFSLLLNLFK